MERRAVVKSNEAVSHFRLPNCFVYRDERTQIGARFLLDTSLSSSALSNNSTRHSVTSRIHRNSRPLSYLIFSTRHLNATLENRENVENFNICIRFFAAPDATRRACLPGPCGWDINAPGTLRVNRGAPANKRSPQCDRASARGLAKARKATLEAKRAKRNEKQTQHVTLAAEIQPESFGGIPA
jgi:hypothetical protein